MTGIMPSATVWRMSESWLEPVEERSAKMRRAFTPLEPTSWMRCGHRLAGALMPTTFGITGAAGGHDDEGTGVGVGVAVGVTVGVAVGVTVGAAVGVTVGV